LDSAPLEVGDTPKSWSNKFSILLLFATAFEICGIVLNLAAMFSVAAFYLHKILYFDKRLDKARNISAFAALTVFSFGRPRLHLLCLICIEIVNGT
jgi:hypothetical protein